MKCFNAFKMYPQSLKCSMWRRRNVACARFFRGAGVTGGVAGPLPRSRDSQDVCVISDQPVLVPSPHPHTQSWLLNINSDMNVTCLYAPRPYACRYFETSKLSGKCGWKVFILRGPSAVYNSKNSGRNNESPAVSTQFDRHQQYQLISCISAKGCKMSSLHDNHFLYNHGNKRLSRKHLLPRLWQTALCASTNSPARHAAGVLPLSALL